MTTVELLGELSRLAPKRCKWGTLRAVDENGEKEFDMVDTCFLRIDTPKPGPADGYVVAHGGAFSIESNDPMILWAVKEEIAARGWAYGLGNKDGSVHVTIEGDGFTVHAASDEKSEAHVMLEALVESLTEEYKAIRA